MAGAPATELTGRPVPLERSASRLGAECGPDSPEDWGPLVGSVLYEPGEAVVLIDPLLPPEGGERERLLLWLDDADRTARP